MTKAEAGAFTVIAVVAAVMAATVLMQNATHNKLIEENSRLRQSAPSTVAEKTLPKSDSGNGTLLSGALMDELLSLRGEVTALRTQSNELARIKSATRAQSAPGPAPAASPAPVSRQVISRDSLAFVGYADPEAALQSAMYAFTTGDLKTLLASVAPEEATNIAKQFSGKSQEEVAAAATAELNGVTAFHVLQKRMISDDEAILAVFAEGKTDNPVESLHFSRINGEWKIAGGRN
jgi:hypothetical protein